MGVGVGTLRSSQVDVRGGGTETGTGRPTIREVCLLGLDLDTRNDGWTTGQEVDWQGRGYRIMATATAPAPPVDGGTRPASPRHYVHLAPRDGDRANR
jgi:hypothetical protein